MWYLPGQWWATNSPNDLNEWRTLLKRGNASNWNVSGDWRKFPHVFLVDRPLTFGHSQLVMPIPPTLSTTEENVSFALASIIIQCAIKGFENAFKEEKKEELHTQRQFYDLAEQTCSYGRYIRTLVMRVSASETQTEEYKVHLVPYFESNAGQCQQRYCATHNLPPGNRGGLIGWLGDRETEVDRWPTGMTDTWKLPELTCKLREMWSR